MLKICSINPKDEYKEIIAGLKKQSEITITKKEIPEEDYYIVNNHFKIKNILDGYQKEKDNIYRKEIEEKNVTVSFFLEEVSSMTLTNTFSSSNKNIEFYGDSNLFKNLFFLANRQDFLEKNNIKDDVDFYKFVANNYVIKNTFFTSTKEMLQNFAFNYFCYISIPKIDAITYINGDFRGWIFELGEDKENKVYQITIINDKKHYGFSTNDPRFNEESFMKEVISSIVISY